MTFVAALVCLMAIALTGLLVLNSRTDPDQLDQPRTSIPQLGIQIICGDCSGDDESPRRTYLNRVANCSVCGGHSYVLASSVYASRMRYLPAYDGIPSGNRVLRFTADRANRVAV